MVKINEMKLTMATAIAAAFGFVIALLWRDIIIGFLKLGGLWREGGFVTLTDGLIALIVVAIITIVCILGIFYISKWGGIKKE